MTVLYIPVKIYSCILPFVLLVTTNSHWVNVKAFLKQLFSCYVSPREIKIDNKKYIHNSNIFSASSTGLSCFEQALP